MPDLRDLPNIGNKLEEHLKEVNIHTPDELKALGSKAAFEKIRILDSGACYNMLCALEGAVQGIRWHHLPEADREDLKQYYLALRQ